MKRVACLAVLALIPGAAWSVTGMSVSMTGGAPGWLVPAPAVAALGEALAPSLGSEALGLPAGTDWAAAGPELQAQILRERVPVLNTLLADLYDHGYPRWTAEADPRAYSQSVRQYVADHAAAVRQAYAEQDAGRVRMSAAHAAWIISQLEGLDAKGLTNGEISRKVTEYWLFAQTHAYYLDRAGGDVVERLNAAILKALGGPSVQRLSRPDPIFVPRSLPYEFFSGGLELELGLSGFDKGSAQASAALAAFGSDVATAKDRPAEGGLALAPAPAAPVATEERPAVPAPAKPAVSENLWSLTSADVGQPIRIELTPGGAANHVLAALGKGESPRYVLGTLESVDRGVIRLQGTVQVVGGGYRTEFIYPDDVSSVEKGVPMKDVLAARNRSTWLEDVKGIPDVLRFVFTAHPLSQALFHPIEAWRALQEDGHLGGVSGAPAMAAIWLGTFIATAFGLFVVVPILFYGFVLAPAWEALTLRRG